MRLASAKWKEVNGKPDKINDLILKTKADLRERPDKHISHPWIMFFFWLTGYHLEREGEGGVRLKFDVQDQGGGRILDVAVQGGWGVLKIGQFS